MQSIKCVAVGDSIVGKTCMLVTFCTERFPGEYQPMISIDWEFVIKMEHTCVKFHPWDTAGHEDYDTVRPLSYPNTDVFLLCFSVADPESFHNIEKQWYPEIRLHNPCTPVILVATKLDLRELSVSEKRSKGLSTFISHEKGMTLADKLKVKYVECSAKTQEGLKQAFDIAINEVFKTREMSRHIRKPQCQCCDLI